MHPGCAPTGARAPQRPAVELGEIVRLHGAALRCSRALTREQAAALRAIERCRTPALGGHLDVCTRCGHQEPSYNSCRNRHCPKCQALAQARWVRGRMRRLLPVPYFHVVFTLPAELRAVAKLNRRLVFAALFDAAAATLLALGHDPQRLGALLGLTAVLHTWSRTLAFHPHVHCIVTGGGWSLTEQRWIAGRPGYLFPAGVLRAIFRGKLLAALEHAHARGALHLPADPAGPDPEGFSLLCDRLRRKPWVVYAKRPFAGPEQVLRYLGRYTHRVGISNHRLVSLDDRGVTFRTKDDQSVTLDPVAFLSRFVEHVLPARFVKMRHYGLLSPPRIAALFATVRGYLVRATPPAAGGSVATLPTAVLAGGADDWRALLWTLTGIDPQICRACGARAVVRRPLPAARSPPARAA